MRNEEEILHQILNFAANNDTIRLVSLEGSRANESLKKDGFEDYDISFFCTDTKRFIENEEWLLEFGDLIFLQKPEDMEFYPPDLKESWFSFLCTYEDGVKIDFTVIPLCDLNFYLKNEKLSKFLLDKDSLISNHKASVEDFFIKKLTQRSFDDVLNEFYHLKSYAYRHFFRKDNLSFTFYINAMRETLFIMLTWELALPFAKINNSCAEFDFSMGKHYKCLKNYISKKRYKKILKTYKLGYKNSNLKALRLIQKLFKKSYKKLAKNMNFNIKNYEHSIKHYIKTIKPKISC